MHRRGTVKESEESAARRGLCSNKRAHKMGPTINCHPPPSAMSSSLPLNHMRVATAGALCALWIAALATPSAAADNPDPRRTTVEQKLKLVGHLLGSPKMKNALAGDNPEARAQAEKAGKLVDQAKDALAANDLDQATAALDQALKSVSAASSMSSKGIELELAGQRARYAELLEQVQTYRAALVETRKDAAAAEAAGAAILRLDTLAADAKLHSEKNKYAEANKSLGDAYLAAANALTRLRAGQTVTLSLKFDTPADEYAYEQKVNLSHEMLVEMLVNDDKARGSMRGAIDKAVDNNRIAKVEAEKQAKAGDHDAAIKTLEQATLRLKRTLQSFGVPIF